MPNDLRLFAIVLLAAGCVAPPPLVYDDVPPPVTPTPTVAEAPAREPAPAAQTPPASPPVVAAQPVDTTTRKTEPPAKPVAETNRPAQVAKTEERPAQKADKQEQPARAAAQPAAKQERPVAVAQKPAEEKPAEQKPAPVAQKPAAEQKLTQVAQKTAEKPAAEQPKPAPREERAVARAEPPVEAAKTPERPNERPVRQAVRPAELERGVQREETERVVAEAGGAVDARPTPTAAAPSSAARRVAFASGFRQPESVLYDAEQDVYFVSNIVGAPAAKDGKGFISRLTPDGKVETLEWVSGGRNDVTLNAPKGMAITGDTLWVSDIDVVRGFHRVTGASVATIDLTADGAVFLNDLAAAPNGAIYVSDTQIKPDERGNMAHPSTDRLFRIGPDRVATIAISTDRFMRPNGIVIDAANERLLVASFGGDTIFAWKPGSGNLTPLASGAGQFDGLVMIEDGRVFATSQATGSVYELTDRGLVERIARLPGAADLGYDAKRRRLLIPLLGQNRVEIYEVP